MLVGKFLAVAFATVVAAQDDGQYLVCTATRSR